MVVPASPAAAYEPIGCKFSTSSLKWQDATTTSGYSAAAHKAVEAWNSTSTQFDINKVRTLSGEISGSSVKVRQLGTQDVDSPDTSRLMEAGRTYLLYLRKNDGKENPDHFVITGGDGIYVLKGSRYVYQGGPQPGSGKRLPAELAAADVERA
ncbi:hypothetical protein [Streptomyces sp. NPDC127084]|uniref:hypothetical protein n=1 Tax=Streptomyces sp. NPDC127084 TaxID=3347133 RepID=UPI003661AF09